jgi:hypothetical protein
MYRSLPDLRNSFPPVTINLHNWSLTVCATNVELRPKPDSSVPFITRAKLHLILQEACGHEGNTRMLPYPGFLWPEDLFEQVRDMVPQGAASKYRFCGAGALDHLRLTEALNALRSQAALPGKYSISMYSDVVSVVLNMP